MAQSSVGEYWYMGNSSSIAWVDASGFDGQPGQTIRYTTGLMDFNGLYWAGDKWLDKDLELDEGL